MPAPKTTSLLCVLLIIALASCGDDAPSNPALPDVDMGATDAATSDATTTDTAPDALVDAVGDATVEDASTDTRPNVDQGFDIAFDLGTDSSIATCDPNPCSDPGRTACTISGDTITCDCDLDRYELDGACLTAGECQDVRCDLRGTCVASEEGDTICDCTTNFAGDDCGLCDEEAGFHDDGDGGCSDDPCVPDPCADDPQRDCVADMGSTDGYLCACEPGTHEAEPGCVLDTECLDNSCNMHGECSDDLGSVVCDCQDGWGGDHCEGCDGAGVYHPDGGGGCTTDPCTPNPLTSTITVADGDLPTSNGDSDHMYLYLRAHDTGALHEIHDMWFNTSGGPYAYESHSLIPNTFDLIYRRDHGFTDHIVDRNEDYDPLPNGYRVLTPCVVVE